MLIYRSYKPLLTALLLFITLSHAYAQVTVTGPTCVVPNTVYQYQISGNWDSTSTLQVCLNGGVIADSLGTNTCSPNAYPISFILVNWNNSGSAFLTITSSGGNATFAVTVVNPLTPGSIDSSVQNQSINYGSQPATISCSLDSGGSCSPSYSYQWQQSQDMLGWSDISGATAQNLSFDSAISTSTFFRRKVTESTSGSIAYSNVAVVTVNIPVPPDSSGSQSDSSGLSFSGRSLIKPSFQCMSESFQASHSGMENIYYASTGLSAVIRRKILENLKLI